MTWNPELYEVAAEALDRFGERPSPADEILPVYIAGQIGTPAWLDAAAPAGALVLRREATEWRTLYFHGDPTIGYSFASAESGEALHRALAVVRAGRPEYVTVRVLRAPAVGLEAVWIAPASAEALIVVTNPGMLRGIAAAAEIAEADFERQVSVWAASQPWFSGAL
jgi:hypothetical protein